MKSLVLGSPVGLICAGLAGCKPTPLPLPAPDPGIDLTAAIEHGLRPAVQVRGEDHRMNLADRMREHRVPAVSIAVFRDDEIVWAKAYGVADVETGRPVDETTLFQAASISKPVNAAVALSAVASGDLTLDGPIAASLDRWQIPDEDPLNPVTLSQLLSHTAGVTVHGFGGYLPDGPLPTLVQILDGTPPANSPPVRLDQPPGSAFRYSGGGISIVQLALIDQLGQPYPEIAKERILEPLGMIHSTFAQPLPADRLPDAAAGHHGDGTVFDAKHFVHPEMAAAGLWTTPTDLARFFVGLSDETVQQMTIPAEIPGDPDAGVGLGVFVYELQGTGFFGHGGSNQGFKGIVRASVDGGYGFAMLANSDNGFALFSEIERALFTLPGWPGIGTPLERIALSSADRDRAVGRYASNPGAPFEIVADQDGLALARPFMASMPLVAVSPTTFVTLDDGTRFELAATADSLEVRPGDPNGGPQGTADRLSDTFVSPLLELAAGRGDAAVEAWRTLEAADAAHPALDEGHLNALGYTRMRIGDIAGALQILEFVTQVRPASSNAFDSLGEARTADGDTTGAITAYETALALLDDDPAILEENRSAVRAWGQSQLDALRAEQTP